MWNVIYNLSTQNDHVQKLYAEENNRPKKEEIRGQWKELHNDKLQY
jgi:hypothetical protein